MLTLFFLSFLQINNNASLWMEELKRNNDLLLLEKYFPGQSCGNKEWEWQGIKFCNILLMILLHWEIESPETEFFLALITFACILL